MKRFWKTANAAEAEGGGWEIRLDSRQVRTPARAVLVVPSRALADAIAEEWAAQPEEFDPRAMPLTGLANAAIDRMAADPDGFATGLARYAETDLLCYRAEEPPELVARQAAQWDPLLDWARERYDIHFELIGGIMHRPQPQATIERLTAAVHACDPLKMAGLSPLVTIGGSLVVGLAVLLEHIEAEAAFDITNLDELWQIEQWGEDYLARDLREAHKRDFLAAARFLTLLG
jgi:chaperone required for assembly of F1-ATPase